MPRLPGKTRSAISTRRRLGAEPRPCSAGCRPQRPTCDWPSESDTTDRCGERRGLECKRSLLRRSSCSRCADWSSSPHPTPRSGSGSSAKPARASTLAHLIMMLRVRRAPHGDTAKRSAPCRPERRTGQEFERGASASLAGGLGFEPRLTESESAVLPLNYPPTRRRRRVARLAGPGGATSAAAAGDAVPLI